MQQNKAVCVLVAPLDWGLGHATRCIPLIKELIHQEVRVIIAASGAQQLVLKQEFPRLEFLEIPGYKIRYNPGFLLKWGLIFRIPSILKQINKERTWMAQTHEQYKFDAVISDNRYGLYHKNLFSVFITHQLFIQSGSDSKKVDSMHLRAVREIPSAKVSVGNTIRRYIDLKILRWNYKFISKFSECWVPDQDGNFSVAGILSHPPMPPPVPLKYIGILSRFKPIEKEVVKNSLLILLSGPEPQRSQFENILFRQLAGTTLKTVVVRGLPGADISVPVLKGAEIYNYLSSEKLNELLNRSEFIIARSGYSTVMDLVRVKKNAILVPTPGQTEQEYLGWYLHEKKWMYSVSQKAFNLEIALAGFKESKRVLPEISDSPLRFILNEFLRIVQKK